MALSGLESKLRSSLGANGTLHLSPAGGKRGHYLVGVTTVPFESQGSCHSCPYEIVGDPPVTHQAAPSLREDLRATSGHRGDEPPINLLRNLELIPCYSD